MFRRINLPAYLIYLFSGRLHLMKDIVQSCVDRIMRVGDISIIPVDFTLVELLFKIGEDTLTVKKTSYSRNTSFKSKNQESVARG
jgi:hypothetical protein